MTASRFQKKIPPSRPSSAIPVGGDELLTLSSTLTPLPPTFPDPYVKVWLMHKDKRVEKKKTVTIKRCLNPVFNESFPFDVPAHVMRETTIIITVMDKDRLSRNDVIGKVGYSII